MPIFNPDDGTPITMFDTSGQLIDVSVKAWAAIVTPTTGNQFTIDISSAGFSQIISVQAQIVKNTTSAVSVPIVAVNSYTTTQVKLNIVQSASTLVSILGTTVSGLLFATSFTGVEIHLFVLGK